MHNMWEGEATINVTEGLRFLERIDDGDHMFNFNQLALMEKQYPFTLYPLYRLQVTVYPCVSISQRRFIVSCFF